MIAHTLDDGSGAGVTDCEAFADDTAKQSLAAGGAEQDDVATDDVVLGDKAFRCSERRAYDDASARKALADEVVGVAVQAQGHTAGHESTEAVTGGTGERDVDGALGQALSTERLGDLVAEHGADRAVDVGDRGLEGDRLTLVECVAGRDDQLLIKCLVETVILRAGRSEEHKSELQSLMRISYAVFCLNKKTTIIQNKKAH